jgi:hypothetical protein
MINPKLKLFLDDTNIRFTIILGSGFHRNSIGGDSILSSWDKLLLKVSPEATLTEQYHLDFEKIIQFKKNKTDESYQSEKKIVKYVQKLITEEQTKVLKDCTLCYPIGIFNPAKVSDVISLNFDEVPELLLRKNNGVRVGNYKNDSSFSTHSKDSYAYLSTRYKPIYFEENKLIRFWHPHGFVKNNKSIVLGLHRYSHMLDTTIRMRNHHVQHQKLEQKNNTWYKSLIENPVLILGAGMSPTEWDMWFALTSRERANGKTLPIFQMRECECKKDVQHEWFQPLFTGLKFDEQWKELEKLFKKII